MDAVRVAVAALWPDKRKERFGMILEPMQAMVQLALLSYCPIGTKLSISDNLLYLQLPCWKQPVARAMNADKKDDLIYLFNVIARYHRFYESLRNGDDELLRELFQTLVQRAKIGLENLIQTYSGPDCAHLSQTLRLYVQLIGAPDEKNTQDAFSSSGAEIDDVFSQVKNLYSQNDLYVLAYLLRLVKAKPEQYLSYLDATNNAMSPINSSIRKWISNNIVF